MSSPKRSVSLCGSAGDTLDPKVIETVKLLGQETARRNMILFTGACRGYPHVGAKAHFEHEGLSIGISPAKDWHEHVSYYKFPTDVYDSIIFTGHGIKGRNIVLVGSGDVVLCVGGGVGTLNEFTIGYDEGKPIGVLTGSGGLSDDLKSISKKFYTKPRHTKIVIEEKDSIKLLDMVLSHIQRYPNT